MMAGLFHHPNAFHLTLQLKALRFEEATAVLVASHTQQLQKGQV